MNVINLYGGPGSGKSTIAAGLFYMMKIQGYSVELVTEFARDEINNDSRANLKSQDWMFAHQHQRIRRLEGKIDWCVTDSPLLLCITYANERWKDKPYVGVWKEFVLGVDAEYNNHNFFIERPEEGFSEQGRDHTLPVAKLIDIDILNMLRYHKIDHHVVAANKTTANEILDKIRQE